MAESGQWIALFSGGKDSSWALHRAMVDGLPVTQLLTAQPQGDAYLFHVPAIGITPHIAESVGLPIQTFPIEPPTSTDASSEGDTELAALRTALEETAAQMDGDLAGIVAGAVESQFQHTRLERLCAEFDINMFAPLWQCDPVQTLNAMIAGGFDIRIVAVAAAGLDRSWLGRRIDEAAVKELQQLHEDVGIHVLGEGGEYETIVVNGPHMTRPVDYDADIHWDGTRGHLEITDAWITD